ncbi:MAG: toprim domain-containing protein [Alphaproteobacteria bacterium]|nr:toprim domain-containing protein [Alphaproteobacteria bacterium]
MAGEAGKSLAVHLFGTRAGVWSDFASGEAGDALDLVAAVRCGRNVRDAMAWARAWLGRPEQAAPLRTASSGRTPAGPDDDQAERRRKALALFLTAPEGIAGTPVALYLAGRGIDLAELGRAPRALRFHPDAWCSEARRGLPAMLAAITNGAGEHVATHRTWLARDEAGRWRKAPLQEPKKTLGSYAGGFIPLQRGASGKPLRSVPQGETVAIAEGIETALSVALACPELRVIAAVSLGNMARIVLPAAVRTVIVCADNDGAENAGAARALDAALAAFCGGRRRVRLARPPVGKDFNDTLQAGMDT